MVCGVTMLVALVEKTGGMDVFTSLLARLARPVDDQRRDRVRHRPDFHLQQHVGGRAADISPTVPGLVQQVGGGNPLAVALSINVGASIVDVSPLSTLGALCVAAVADADTRAGPVPEADDLGILDGGRRSGAVPGIRECLRAGGRDDGG